MFQHIFHLANKFTANTAISRVGPLPEFVPIMPEKNLPACVKYRQIANPTETGPDIDTTLIPLVERNPQIKYKYIPDLRRIFFKYVPELSIDDLHALLAYIDDGNATRLRFDLVQDTVDIFRSQDCGETVTAPSAALIGLLAQVGALTVR